MNTPDKTKGPWIVRFAIHTFTLAFAILVFWLLGFLVNDIRSIPGPNLHEIERRYIGGALEGERRALNERIAETTRQIKNAQETQRQLGDSSRNLRETMNQLLDLQRGALEKSIRLSDQEQANLGRSLNGFLENQTKYQTIAQSLAEQIAAKQDFEQRLADTERRIDEKSQLARIEYKQLYERHRLKLGIIQIAVLLPLLAIAAFFLIGRRRGIYTPLFLAFAGATLLKIALVVHAYFPSRYFKYALILALILVVGRILIHLIRTIAFPRAPWLLKQYREAYERFLCPVCEYPIRTGPRRFLFWTRRTVHKAAIGAEGNPDDEPYTCPACGTPLFEKCPSCGHIRHALLPSCRHCGERKDVTPDARA